MATPLFQPYLVPIAVGILVAVFAVQRLRSDNVGSDRCRASRAHGRAGRLSQRVSHADWDTRVGSMWAVTDRAFWTAFLRSLVKRGLHGVRLIVTDAHEG